MASPNPYLIPPSSPSPSSAPFSSYFSRFSKWREDLGLPNPGSVENLQKEVKGAYSISFFLFSDLNCFSATHLTNYAFDGGRADLTKSMSMSPLFQVTHSFALGAQNMASSYNFGAIYATENVLFFLLRNSCTHPSSRSSFKVVSTMTETSALV